MHSPQLRSALSLAAVAFAALAVSLLLAFASATALRPDANREGAPGTTPESRFGTQARETTAETPVAAPTAQPPAVSTAAGAGGEHEQPPLLWPLLAPWAFAVDGIAVLGLAAILIVRYNARHRRRART